MPANGFDDSETWAILAYLRSLAPAKTETVSGDPAKGRKIFWETAGCSTCHMVQGRGGVLGPDLSRVGEARSVPYLIDSIREPSKELSSGMLDPNNHYGLPLVYDTVTVVTASGQKIVGVAKNEDTFSIQLLDTNQQLQFFLKKNLKEVTHERKSLMPAYSEDDAQAGGASGPGGLPGRFTSRVIKRDDRVLRSLLACCCLEAAAHSRAGHLPALARRRSRTAELAHLFGALRRLALQRAGPDQYRQRFAACDAVDVSGRRPRPVRDHTPGGGRRLVRNRTK